MLYIDGQKVTTIGDNETICIPISTGVHYVHVRIDWYHSNNLGFEVKANQNLRLEIATGGLDKKSILKYSILAVLGFAIGAVAGIPIGSAIGAAIGAAAGGSVGICTWLIVYGRAALKPVIYEVSPDAKEM